MRNSSGYDLRQEVDVFEDLTLRRFRGVPTEQLAIDGSITKANWPAVKEAIEAWVADPAGFWFCEPGEGGS